MVSKSKLCVESFTQAEASDLNFALSIADCVSTVEKCDTSLKRVEEGFLIQSGSKRLKICSGGSDKCDVKLNNQVETGFIHYIINNGVKFSYVTEKPIDLNMFTGIMSCFLAKKWDAVKAFNETMVFFTIGGGDLYEAIRRAIKQTFLMDNLLLNVEKIESNAVPLGKIGVKEVLIGARFVDKVVLYRFSLDSYGLVGLRIETLLNSNPFQKIPPNNDFLCFKEVDVDFAKYGYSTIAIGEYRCVFGDEIYGALNLLFS